MDDINANVLLSEATAIDATESAHAEAAATGNLDDRGQIIAPPGIDERALEWFLIPKVIAWGITTVFPETAPNYTDERCMELARAIVPVAEKYGLSGMGDSPELVLLMGCGAFGAPAYMAHKARQARAQAEERARQDGEDGS